MAKSFITLLVEQQRANKLEGDPNIFQNLNHKKNT